MTDNRNPEAARTYHDATKHSYTSVRTNPHFMDWSNQPLPFKIYPTLEPMRLPSEVRQPGSVALSALPEASPPRPTHLLTWKRWPSSSTYPPASHEKETIPAANSTFAPPPAPARST